MLGRSLFAGAAPLTGTLTWNTLKIGAGGVVGRMSIHSSGNKLVGADIFGAYACTNAAPTWVGMFTPTNGAQITNPGYGMWDVEIAPSNVNTYWVVSGDGYTYRSTDAGANWTKTAFSQFTGAEFDVAGGNYRWSQQHLAVDPNNHAVAFVTNTNGAIEVTRDGGVTKSAVPGLTGTGAGPGGAGIAFYAGDGTTTISSVTVTKTLYIGIYNTGVFRSTDGGQNWTQISSSGTTGPTQVWQAQIIPSGTYAGTYWCSEMPVGQTGKCWKYVPGSPGTWTERQNHAAGAMTGIQACAVDPVMSGRVVFMTRGGVAAWETLDNGSTLVGNDEWSGAWPTAPTLTATDIPWIATSNPGYLETWTARFDPSSTNGTKCTKLYIGMGVGVAYIDWPTTFVGITVTSQSLGIEELVCHDIYIPPSSSTHPILAAADRPLWVPTLGTYPSVYGPVGGPDFNRCWSLAAASSDPTYVAGLTRWFGASESGISMNGGVNWTPFTNDPQANDGGVIACASPTSFVVVSNFENPKYATSVSSTWTDCAGLPAGTDGSYFPGAYQHVSPIDTDKVNANTYYLYRWSTNRVYRSTDGGQNWSIMGSTTAMPTNQIGWLKCHPANAGDLFFQNWGLAFLRRSTDGGATWNDLGFSACTRMGFGKELAGSTFKTVFVIGTRGGNTGLWVSKDNCSTWIDYTSYGLPTVSSITCLSGDPSLAGRFIIGTYGNGYYYGDVT